MQSGVYFSFMYYEVWEYEFVPLEIVQGDTHLSSIVRSIVTAFEKGMELASQLRKDIPNTGPLCWGSARGTERICCQPTGRQQRRKPVRGVMDRLGRILDDAKANGDVDEQALILFLQLSNTVIRRIWRRNNKELTISRFCEERAWLEKLLAEVCFDFNTTLMRLMSISLPGDLLAQQNRKREGRLELLDAAARTAEHTGRALLNLTNGPGRSTLRLPATGAVSENKQRNSPSQQSREPHTRQREELRKHGDPETDYKKPPARKVADGNGEGRVGSSPSPSRATTALPELPCISPLRHSTQRPKPIEWDNNGCRGDDTYVAELEGQNPNAVPSSDPAGLEPVIPPPVSLYPPPINPPPYSPMPRTHEINVPTKSGPPSDVSIASDNMPLGEIPAHKLAKPVSQIRAERRQRSDKGGKLGFWTRWVGKGRKR